MHISAWQHLLKQIQPIQKTSKVTRSIITVSVQHIYGRFGTSPRHLAPLSFRWESWNLCGFHDATSSAIPMARPSQANPHAGFWTVGHSPDTGQSGSQIPYLLRYLKHDMSCLFYILSNRAHFRKLSPLLLCGNKLKDALVFEDLCLQLWVAAEDRHDNFLPLGNGEW